MAILAAFNSPEVEVIGLTTIFGNVHTAQATQNAFVLLKLVGHEEASCAIPFLSRPTDWTLADTFKPFLQVPVAEGSPSMLSGLKKAAVAAFVHGEDGFGNTKQEVVQVQASSLSALLQQSSPADDQYHLQGRKLDKSAAQFIVDTVNASPGEVSILALGPLTNLALAFQLDPKAAQNMARRSGNP
jgi:uridine nucleosidase